MKIQECGKDGGYEATVRAVDVERLAQMRGRRLACDGKSELLGETWEFGKPADEPQSWVKAPKSKGGAPTEENAYRAARRAKRKVRWLCKWIAADRLLTFTSRNLLSSLDETLTAWRRFTRLYRRIVGDESWGYVAAIERHKSGYYHLHVAISGWFHLGQAHRLWQIALGGQGHERGSSVRGTIDLDKRGKGKAAPWKIAKYISKYMTKEFAESAHLGRKRYWASESELPQARRLWLTSATRDEAFGEALQLLALDSGGIGEAARHGQVFLAESGDLAWWYWSPEWGRSAALPF